MNSMGLFIVLLIGFVFIYGCWLVGKSIGNKLFKNDETYDNSPTNIHYHTHHYENHNHLHISKKDLKELNKN